MEQASDKRLFVVHNPTGDRAESCTGTYGLLRVAHVVASEVRDVPVPSGSWDLVLNNEGCGVPANDECDTSSQTFSMRVVRCRRALRVRPVVRQ